MTERFDGVFELKGGKRQFGGMRVKAVKRVKKGSDCSHDGAF